MTRIPRFTIQESPKLERIYGLFKVIGEYAQEHSMTAKELKTSLEDFIDIIPRASLFQGIRFIESEAPSTHPQP